MGRSFKRLSGIVAGRWRLCGAAAAAVPLVLVGCSSSKQAAGAPLSTTGIETTVQTITPRSVSTAPRFTGPLPSGSTATIAADHAPAVIQLHLGDHLVVQLPATPSTTPWSPMLSSDPSIVLVGQTKYTGGGSDDVTVRAVAQGTAVIGASRGTPTCSAAGSLPCNVLANATFKVTIQVR